MSNSFFTEWKNECVFRQYGGFLWVLRFLFSRWPGYAVNFTLAPFIHACLQLNSAVFVFTRVLKSCYRRWSLMLLYNSCWLPDSWVTSQKTSSHLISSRVGYKSDKQDVCQPDVYLVLEIKKMDINHQAISEKSELNMSSSHHR